MSHFCVLVVGDVDYELAPFHEFECTGLNDEFVQSIDDTEQQREDYNEYGEKDENGTLVQSFREYLEGENRPAVEPGQEPDFEGEHKFGYCLVGESGNVLQSFNRTNPRAKWDWYVPGGRWSGYLTSKAGNAVDSAQVKDVDWGAKKAARQAQAREQWEEMAPARALGPITSWSTFLEWRDAGSITIEQAREQYHTQPALEIARKIDPFVTFDGESAPAHPREPELGRSAPC
jgi:hypothetical protein